MINLVQENSNIPFESKRNSDCPYWYIFKHGIGPGTIPDDVKIGKVKDLDNYYSIVWLDRPLSTDELKYYDIYPETMNRQILKGRLGYSDAEIDDLVGGKFDECNEDYDITGEVHTCPNCGKDMYYDELLGYYCDECGEQFDNDELDAELQLENTDKSLKEYVDDDEEELDDGDVVYEGKAYYNKRYSGLAHSEQFSNASDMWGMCQDGYYVTVYDYEDGSYSYYKYPDNGAYMDLSSAEELETDERGNFLYIDDIGPK